MLLIYLYLKPFKICKENNDFCDFLKNKIILNILFSDML